MAGIEDQVREMEQRLAAQFQQQLLQAQEGQRLQLETLTQLVTQQRVAGAGLEQQVAAQRQELGTQQREGQELLQEVAAQRAAGREILEQREELRAAGQELEAEREVMRGAGTVLEQQVADLQRQMAALREERNAAVAAATQAAEAFAQLQAAAGDLDDLRAGGGGAGAGDRPVKGRDKRLLSNLFEAGKAPMLGEKGSSQEQLESAWGDFAVLFELRLLRGLEDADAALRFAEAQGDPDTSSLTPEEVTDAGYAEHSAAVYDALSACCHMGSAPMMAVRLHEATKNGLAVWQRLHFV